MVLRFSVDLLLGAGSKCLWRSGSETLVEDVKGGASRQRPNPQPGENDSLVGSQLLSAFEVE
jgi:hypothetical protein